MVHAACETQHCAAGPDFHVLLVHRVSSAGYVSPGHFPFWFCPHLLPAPGSRPLRAIDWFTQKHVARHWLCDTIPISDHPYIVPPAPISNCCHCCSLLSCPPSWRADARDWDTQLHVSRHQLCRSSIIWTSSRPPNTGLLYTVAASSSILLSREQKRYSRQLSSRSVPDLDTASHPYGCAICNYCARCVRACCKISKFHEVHCERMRGFLQGAAQRTKNCRPTRYLFR